MLVPQSRIEMWSPMWWEAIGLWGWASHVLVLSSQEWVSSHDLVFSKHVVPPHLLLGPALSCKMPAFALPSAMSKNFLRPPQGLSRCLLHASWMFCRIKKQLGLLSLCKSCSLRIFITMQEMTWYTKHRWSFVQCLEMSGIWNVHD